jgi:hypothetical protein
MRRVSVVLDGTIEEHPMKVFRVVAVIALMTGPAYAQTLIQSFESKTPQQKADEELKEKNFKESTKTTPEGDTRTSVDAWGNVRGGDAAKNSTAKSSASKSSASKNSNSRTATSAKPAAPSQ